MSAKFWIAALWALAPRGLHALRTQEELALGLGLVSGNETNFLTVRKDYEPFIRREVVGAETAASWLRQGFTPFGRRKDWSLTSSLGMQEAIVSVLYDDLQHTKQPVIDVGSGHLAWS
ncbi:unnamed protein product [Symbiodinium natans]|uniref:Uncharacterized protein n=1 Tax=Symbiodinium natans TaxID=878477 RepID=A0A812S2W7_9DINO|nr:unnamed protein product [Symbiodinium natans]